MDLLKRLESEPDKLLAEARPDVSDDHMNEHMSFLLAFLLAHEAWHLRNGTVSEFDSPQQAAPPVRSELQTRIMCRNLDEYVRVGKQFEIKHPLVPLKEEDVPSAPDERQDFDASRKIWEEELDADKYAGEILAKVVLKAREAGIAEGEVQRIFSENMMHLGLLMLTQWHSRLTPFADQYCSEFARQDFYLTRCMCQSKDRYSQVQAVFVDTHPPIVLRIYAAATTYLKTLGIGKGKDVNAVFPGRGKALQAAVNWYQIIDAITDVPFKLTLPACKTVILDTTASDGRIVQVLPELAGIFGPSGSAVYPGYPADEGALIMQCVPPEKTGTAVPK
jgi:hypothetical protein